MQMIANGSNRWSWLRWCFLMGIFLHSKMVFFFGNYCCHPPTPNCIQVFLGQLYPGWGCWWTVLWWGRVFQLIGGWSLWQNFCGEMGPIRWNKNWKKVNWSSIDWWIQFVQRQVPKVAHFFFGVNCIWSGVQPIWGYTYILRFLDSPESHRFLRSSLEYQWLSGWSLWENSSGHVGRWTWQRERSFQAKRWIFFWTNSSYNNGSGGFQDQFPLQVDPLSTSIVGGRSSCYTFFTGCIGC